MTLEDETGIANIIIWPSLLERFRPIILGGRLTAVTGRLQRESGVTHIVAERLQDFSGELAAISEAGASLGALARADEVRRPGNDARTPPERSQANHAPAGRAPPRISLARTLAIEALLREEPSLAEDIAAEQARKAMPKGRNFH